MGCRWGGKCCWQTLGRTNELMEAVCVWGLLEAMGGLAKCLEGSAKGCFGQGRYEGLVLIGVTCNVPCWLSHWICLWEVGKEDHKWWSHDVAHCIVHICELHTHASRLWSHDCKDAAMVRTLRTSHFFSTAVTEQWLKQWMHTTCSVQMDWDCQYKSVFKKYSEGLLN